MLSKDEAYKMMKEAQFSRIENAIKEYAIAGAGECEITNISDEEKAILVDAGYKVNRIATKNGYVNKITWE